MFFATGVVFSRDLFQDSAPRPWSQAVAEDQMLHAAEERLLRDQVLTAKVHEIVMKLERSKARHINSRGSICCGHIGTSSRKCPTRKTLGAHFYHVLLDWQAS